MRQGDNGPRAPDLRGAGAALSGTDAPTGVASHQDGHLEEGPRLCDLGTTVDSNTARQAAREWCEGGPPLRSDQSRAMPLAKRRKAVARASSAARGRPPARHDHHDPGPPPSLSSCGGAGASPPPSCPRVATLTSASGNFCPSQKTARAFEVTECVQMRQGDRLARGQAPHAAILVSAFCILTTINAWQRIARAHRNP